MQSASSDDVTSPDVSKEQEEADGPEEAAAGRLSWLNPELHRGHFRA